MQLTEPCFTLFNQAVDNLSLPEHFTFPFFYQPHPLSIVAATQLQHHIEQQNQWHHDFDKTGKMFGVLVVKNQQNELGFISAFSGKLADLNVLPGFVPPVFDLVENEATFAKDLEEITELSKQLKFLSDEPRLDALTNELMLVKQTQESVLEKYREQMAKNRQARKSQRSIIQAPDTLTALNDQLAKQSIADKNGLRDLKIMQQRCIDNVQSDLAQLSEPIKALTTERKTLAGTLQHKIFAQYQFLNSRGESADLNDIFKSQPVDVPPAGAGECAAPKLLQYAFLHQLTPVALAEFWWGAPPSSEIRQHQNFYPSCTSKCQPILGHMLDGMALDDNPLLAQPTQDKPIEVLFEDDAIAVINKPHNLLSVPGKTIKDSVLSRMRERYPDATGPLIVHRLDMATSGLMLIALTQRANKSLTKQFRMHTIKKQYVALIEGNVSALEGEINLPLRGDLYDRPRQLVCFEHGKTAHTLWQVIERINDRTKLLLRPTTGRTHQLRVHCAHNQGFGMPIVGDTLYGKEDVRLHLHAQSIEFCHPYSHQKMQFEAIAPF